MLRLLPPTKWKQYQNECRLCIYRRATNFWNEIVLPCARAVAVTMGKKSLCRMKPERKQKTLCMGERQWLLPQTMCRGGRGYNVVFFFRRTTPTIPPWHLMHSHVQQLNWFDGRYRLVEASIKMSENCRFLFPGREQWNRNLSRCSSCCSDHSLANE